MLRKDALHEIEDFMTERAFYSDKHRHIWKAMAELAMHGDPIDLVSVSTYLKDKGLLESIGGASEISSLVESVPSAANIAYYADIVYKKYQLRSLIEAAEGIVHTAFTETEETVEALLDAAEKRIFSVTTNNKAQRYTSIKDSLKETWEELSRVHDGEGLLRGVPTGYQSLDYKLSGLQKSDLVILAARPSMGKTTLALDIARNTAIHGNTPVVIFSLENVPTTARHPYARHRSAC
jgi:replicative DNA helicase